MAADFVACHCKKCDQLNCTSVNDWIELDSGHVTYRDPNYFSYLGMLVTGQRKPGIKDFLGCFRQRLNCAGCGAKIGFKCVDTIREKSQYRQVYSLSSELKSRVESSRIVSKPCFLSLLSPRGHAPYFEGDRDFLVLNSLVLKPVVDSGPVAPLIKKEGLLNAKETSSPQPDPLRSRASKVSNSGNHVQTTDMTLDLNSTDNVIAPENAISSLPDNSTSLYGGPPTPFQIAFKDGEESRQLETPAIEDDQRRKSTAGPSTGSQKKTACESCRQRKRACKHTTNSKATTPTCSMPTAAKSQTPVVDPGTVIAKAPKPMITRTPSAQVPMEGLPPADTELITRNIAKAMSEPAKRETSDSTPTTASQALENQLSQVHTKLIDRDVARAGSDLVERASSNGATLPNPPAPSTNPQSSGIASGLGSDSKALLGEQRADIDRIAANVDSLAQDMKGLKASIDYLKFQQKTFAEHETAPSPTALAEDIHVLSRQSQSLTESVSHLRTKATDVEEIKLELEFLRQRVKYLEGTHVPVAQTATGSAQHTTSASRREEHRRLNSHAQSESVYVSGGLQDIPSPTLLAPLSTQASASRKTSAYSLPQDIIEIGDTCELRDSEQIYAMPPSSGEDMTPEVELSGIEEPRITSAAKVAAQKRRRLSDSSSDTRSAKKHGWLPKSKHTQDWTTGPISLNDHRTVFTSDPEDDDYDPKKFTQEIEDARINGKTSRTFKKAPVRLPTPEWEKPDWEGPSDAPPANSTRGKMAVRRGVSGRGPLIDRDTVRRRSAGYGNGDYVYFDSPKYWDDQGPMSTPSASMPDPFEKPRDSQGRLIRQNGKVDGRSLRHKRAREEKARQAAVQQQLQMTSRADKNFTEGQQKQMQAMGLTAPSTGESFVDAAALQAARYSGAASPATPVLNQSLSANDAIEKEKDGAGDNNEAAPSATAGATAPQPPNDRHAALMKQMFPWR
ncbi:MAG: hypothetical protein Q9172_006391 [Xanthocarpia lactea]